MVELAPDYYHRNLGTVVDTVVDAHPELFGPEHHAVFRAWRAVPREASLLYSRLLMRKGPDFRRNSLSYAEVGPLDPALAALAEVGLVTLDPPLELADRLEHYTVPELRAVAQALGRPRSPRRPDLLAGLLADPEGVAAAVARIDGVVRRHGTSAFARAQVVFFGNRQQDMSTFVRVALDQLKYADYPVDRSHPLFPSAAALDDYLAAGARWDAAFEAREAQDHATLARLGTEAAFDLTHRPEVAPFRARVDPARADARVVYRAARAHESHGQVAEAEGLYQLLLQHRRHLPTSARAGDRLGLLLQRARRAEGLAERLAPLLAEPGLDGPSRRLVERRLRLTGALPPTDTPEIPERELTLRGLDASHPQSPTAAGPLGFTGTKALYQGLGGQPRTVEQAVLERLGGDGVWCEGSLYTTLFGLLCWDAVFAPLPGAFQHPFQDAPVDFDTALFHLRREGRFRSRFDVLRGADLAVEVALAAHRHQGRACRGVAWDRYPPDLLSRVAGALGRRLVPILERLARHPGRHGAGLPDLFVFTDQGPLLVEVKGPGDQPSVEQQLWHTHLVGHQVPFVLMRVRRGSGLG